MKSILFLKISPYYLDRMELAEAQELIMKGVGTDTIAKWVDLGCGTGTFTNALASLLHPGSYVHAVDKDQQHLNSINPLVTISFEKAAMESVVLETEVNGILMANSIHYVKDKASLLRRLATCLASDGKLIIVEYDSMRSNAWVPHPITFDALEQLVNRLGFREIVKLNERPSRYGGVMYACMIR